MQDSVITVQGRVATVPEMKISKGGSKAPFAMFRIASTPRRQVSGAPGTYEDGETSWFTVFAWGNLGANVLTSIDKGHPVVVHGRLAAREYKKEDGTLDRTVSIVANGVGHDLTFGKTAYEKVVRPSYGDGDRLDEALREVRDVDGRSSGTGDGGPAGFGDPETDDYLLADRPEEGNSGPLVGEPAA